MNPQDLIDSYVDEVVRELPRKQREDVGLELRELLTEGLTAKAAAARGVPDEATTVAFLQGFGRPDDIARRYRPAFTVIEPTRVRRLIRSAIVGVVGFWIIGLADTLNRHLGSGQEIMAALREWAVNWVLLAVFFWPGFLVVNEVIANLLKRKEPEGWQPTILRAKGAARRMTLFFFAPLSIVWLIFVVSPVWFLGHILPAGPDVSWARYAETFQHERLAPLLMLMAALYVLQVVAAVRGRWTLATRQTEIGFSLGLAGVRLWCVLAGPILQYAPLDHVIRVVFALVAVIALIRIGVTLYRGDGGIPSLHHTLNADGK